LYQSFVIAEQLLEKYEKDNILTRLPGLTLKLHPELTVIDAALEDEELFCMIRDDLSQRYANTLVVGRYSTPVEVILRMMAVRHLYDLSYTQTEVQVADSLVLRQFCRVYLHAVPDHTTLCKWAQLIQPQTLQAFNERVLSIAVGKKLTRGRKLRMDGMVVETHVQHPTDSRLLADSVRVIGRSLRRAQALVGKTAGLVKPVFRNRTRSARRAARQIAQLSRRGRQHTRSTYERLVRITRKTVQQAQRVLEALQTQAQEEGQALIQTLETFLPRAQQVIDQTVRRVCDDEQVPASEKIVSIFEPHTDIIRRGKANKDTEFGHKVWLAEVEGGFISQYRVLEGNPADDAQWEPTLEQHVDQFGHPPWQASADRGVFSAYNETAAERLDVQRIILPKPGHKSAARKERERQRWFRRGRCFHAGIEGRISVVSRKHGLDRCRDKGKLGFDRWVGWGVIANNLTIMGRKLAT
jgi:IS5 family transposase